MNDKVLLCRDLMGDHGQSRWPDQAESTDQEVRICDWLHSEEERVRLNDALQLWIGVMHPSVCTCCLTRCLHLTVLMLSNRGMSGDVSLFDSSAVAVATWSTQWLGGPCDILQEKKPVSKSQFSASPVWMAFSARFLPYPHSAHSRAHTCAALTIIT